MVQTFNIHHKRIKLLLKTTRNDLEVLFKTGELLTIYDSSYAMTDWCFS